MSIQFLTPGYSLKKSTLIPSPPIHNRRINVSAPKLQFSGKKHAGHPPVRKILGGAAIASTALIEAVSWIFPPARLAYLVTVPLIGLGTYDVLQKKHAILRNFPILGHFRYGAETIRPEIHQYFVESDTDGVPFSKIKRDTIYQLAKKDVSTMPFGTRLDPNQIGAEMIGHSVWPLNPLKEEPRIKVGGLQCKQPYEASMFNISAMSYGALSKNAVMALNKGAFIGSFLHNTGEGGLSPYHFGLDVDIEAPGFDLDKCLAENKEKLKESGDLTWQIGTGYFGCRTKDGNFNPELFKKRVALPSIKMIEVKLSQGAKPGHGGILPAAKVTPGIANLRGVEVGKDVISPPGHTAFSTPVGLLQFIQQLRELSNGKPVGFKLCLGQTQDFLDICKAMVQTGIYPDFITVDGKEGGTGAAPREFSDNVGLPLNEALVFIHNALVGCNLRDKIKLIAAGKITDAFDIVTKLAMGADMCNSARGMMFALGCIQALQCHLNTCPTGVATQDPELVKGLVVEDKKSRVANYHDENVHRVLELVAAAGLESPSLLKPEHIKRRDVDGKLKPLNEIYDYIPAGSLLGDNPPPSFAKEWRMADPYRNGNRAVA
jgi:glutamate synthase domain-containing protein 2